MAYVSDVFDSAMALIDELDDTGSSDAADTAEYKNRTPAIVSILIGECYPYSENYAAGTRRSGWTPVTAQDDYIDGVDDTLCLTVMPYGLAASLLVDENPAAAGFFQQRYEALLARFGKELPSDWESIADVYGGIENGGFGRW
ncbi:MAG: hypothetical protein AB7C97_09595 [Oscillospiraceae bacterium]